eukprot:scaffold63643_cov24-Attheya_sp.AAC.2
MSAVMNLAPGVEMVLLSRHLTTASSATVRRYVALRPFGTSVCRMKNIVSEPDFMLGRTPWASRPISLAQL